jgi:two-component system, NtrC family, sensor kinase
MAEMSLRYKVSLMLLIIFILYAGLSYGVQRLIIFPRFVALEIDEAKKDMERCMEAIGREIHHLDLATHDWAAWDEAYQFVENRNRNFVKVNLVPELFETYRLNLIYFYNLKGELVWGKACDLATGQNLEIGDFSPGALSRNHLLLAHQNVTDCVAGIFMTERGPILLASRPIVRSNWKGPIRGTLIMGRFLGQKLVNKLVEQTLVKFQVQPIQKSSFSSEQRKLVARITPANPFLISDVDEKLLQVYTTYPGINGMPAILIRAEVTRGITAKGITAIWFATASIIGAALVVLTVLWLLLKHTVVGPLSDFTGHVTAIGNGSLEEYLPVNRKDEIGVLSAEFNRMLCQLSEARQKLLEQSYHSGMAEMASGVLHNIRNALNPMIVDIYELRQDLKRAPLDQIALAQAELAQEISLDNRRQDLNHFLELAYGSVLRLFQETQVNLDSLSDKTAQIEKILADHEKFSHARRPTERFRLDEVINSALTLLPDKLQNTMVVKVDPGITEIGLIRTHRASLLQVFANILTNAAESIQRKGSLNGTVTISAGVNLKEGDNLLHIQISDNGEGIEAVNLGRIFERGFSLKQKPSSGLGLHWCANTISALKGHLYAESDSNGQGACFHLVLPRNYEPSND